MNNIYILVLNLLIIFNASCTHRISKVDKNTYLVNNKKEITLNDISKESAIYDTYYLFNLLKKGYAGYDYVEPEIWEKSLSNIILEIKNIDENLITTEKYLKTIAYNLKDLVDGHFLLEMTNKSRFMKNISDYESYFLLEKNCILDKSIQFKNELKIRFYDLNSSKISEKKIVSLMDSIYKEMGKQKECLYDLKYKNEISEYINNYMTMSGWHYIKINSFSIQNKKYFELIEKLTHILNTSSNIILDLRGNTGGALSAISELFLKIGINLDPYSQMIFKENIVTRQLQINAADKLFRMTGSKSFLKRKKYYKDILNSMASDFEKIHYIEKIKKKNKHKKYFSGKLTIIVDNDCSSACEGVLMMAKSIKNTLIIGSNSGGKSIIGYPIKTILKKSKALVTFGIYKMTSFINDKSYKENRGYLPDIWIDHLQLNVLSPNQIIEALKNIRRKVNEVKF